MGTPIKPIQQQGITTRRALEQFKLKYNVALAALASSWGTKLSDVSSSDSLKESYPVSFSVQAYTELAGQEGDAIDTKLTDVDIVKREFSSAALGDIKRIKRGDHAYVKSWNRRGPAMAVARGHLRNRMLRDLMLGLEAPGSCKLDKAAFFDVAHPVNPFDDSVEDTDGENTWSNLETVATPLNGPNLTAQKTKMKMVPGPDGEKLSLNPTMVLVPTILDETAFNLFSVQDLIANASGNAGVRNPHFKRGMFNEHAPELPGADANADWYLADPLFMALMGMYAFVFAEDPAHEWVEWDEKSGFAKRTGHVKVESRVMGEVAALFPHGIRKVKGS